MSEEPGRSSVLIVGAGLGVSGSLARRYAAEDWDVDLLGADESALRTLAEELGSGGSSGVRAVAWRVADLTDVPVATEAISELARGRGRVDVLHVNPSAFRQEDPLHLSVEHLLADVALGVGSLLVAAQAARPFMATGGRVTVTGSMAADEPWHEAASLGVQKAGVRNLVHSLDATLRKDGIRAVSVTVCGTLSDEGAFTPDRVAEQLVLAARQDESSWQTEVRYTG